MSASVNRVVVMPAFHAAKTLAPTLARLPPGLFDRVLVCDDASDDETVAVARTLDVLLDAGIEAPYSCREGHCGACATTIVDGEVEMEVNDVLEPDDLADGLILACQAHPVSDTVEVNYD
jgi:ferredoxin